MFFFYFGQKLSAALSLLISGVGLELIGYINPIGNAATIQSDSTLKGIVFLQTLAPAILIFIGSYFIGNYPITNQIHKDIVTQLQEQGNQNGT